MQVPKRLPRNSLEDLIDIDHENELALVLQHAESEREPQTIAVARYFRDKASNFAEVAFMVDDRWQGKRLGAELFLALAEVGRAHDIRGFTAEVLLENRAMMHLFQSTGLEVSSSLDGGTYHRACRSAASASSSRDEARHSESRQLQGAWARRRVGGGGRVDCAPMKTLVAALVLSLVSSCALLEEQPPIEDYTLVFLVTDRPTSDFDEEVLGTAMKGHFDNITRLSDEQLLLLAGPLGEPRSDPLHRGIFLFDIDDSAIAETLVRTDPAVAAGIFAPRVYPFSSATPFKTLPRLEVEALAARRLEDPEAEEWIGRGYVLVSCPDGLAAEQALARYRDPLVLFSGRLGGGLEGTGLFGLDLETVDEARRVLELAGPELDWSYHPWWGTERLAQFLVQ